MSAPCFIADLADPRPGDVVTLEGSEAHHAAAVRRIRTGEVVLVTDGQGRGVRGPVVAADRRSVRVEVAEVVEDPPRRHTWVAVQALAKGERADLAVEMLTELGVDEILAWQSARSVVRWDESRRERGLTRWRSTAREATKQSRRLRVPQVDPATTEEVVARIEKASRAFVLHESADAPIHSSDVPGQGEVLLVVGPEGGLTDEEVARFTAAGAVPVLVADAVLRTSTAGVVGLAQLQALSAPEPGLPTVGA